MAQRTIVSFLDDFDGTEATGTVTFALDGTAYEIDLSDKNAATLRDGLAPFVAAARKVKGAKGAKGTKAPAKPADGKPAKVREWAAANGVEVNEKGRVPASVVEAYDAANPEVAATA